jgi:hypothetical protein
MLSTVEDNLASYKQEVTDTYATQQMVTAVGDNLASYKQEVADTYATQEMVTTLETNTSKALTDYKQEVQEGYATQEMVTKLETDTSKALTDYKQEVGDTYATQESLTTLRTDTTDAITASEERATATYASKSDLTTFESNTNIAMARIEQKADANGAYIQSTVSNMDKYAVGPYSHAYGFTLEQAREVLEEGMVYVPTEDTTETYDCGVDEDGNKITYTKTFSNEFYYVWEYIDNLAGIEAGYMWKEYGTAANPPVYPGGIMPAGNAYSLWYTNSDTVTDGYEPYTLYKLEEYKNEADETLTQWVAVATLQGNSSNRAVSQIRQDANSIELDVTNAKGDLAGIKVWAGDDFSAIQDTVTWKGTNGDSLVTFMQTAGDNFASASQVAKIVDKDGNINEASIVAVVNDNASDIYLSADNITMNGTTKFLSPNDVGKNGSTTIDGARITTGTIDADRIDVQDLIATGSIAVTSDIPTETDITTITNKTISTTNVTAVNLKVKAANIEDKLTATQIKVTDLNAFGATIGGWTIGSNNISSNDCGLYSDMSKTRNSLVTSGETSPVRFYAGTIQTVSTSVSIPADGSEVDATFMPDGMIEAQSVQRNKVVGTFTQTYTITPTYNSGYGQYYGGDSAKFDQHSEDSGYGCIIGATVKSKGDASNVIIEVEDANDDMIIYSIKVWSSYANPVTVEVQYEVDVTDTFERDDIDIVKVIQNGIEKSVVRIDYDLYEPTDLTYIFYLDVKGVMDGNYGTFCVLQDGSMYTNAIQINGGKVASFTIEDKAMYGSQVGMCSESGPHWAFWAGADKNNDSMAPFRVGHNGELYASKGNIGGWTIDGDALTGLDEYGTIVKITPKGVWCDGEHKTWSEILTSLPLPPI